jgi:hypothetical protein
MDQTESDNPGGSAPDRRKFRRALDRALAANRNAIPPEIVKVNPGTSDSAPPAVQSRSMAKQLSSAQVGSIFLTVFGVVLAVVGVQEMFPLTINLAVYLASTAILFWGGWRWEKAAEWSKTRRLITLVPVFLLWIFFLSYPISRQYAKEVNIDLSFKDSPEMTWWREQVITWDLSRMQKYLSGLGLKVPSALPPISVVTGRFSNVIGSTTPPDLPVKRGSLFIGASLLNDRSSATAEYVRYVLDENDEMAIYRAFPDIKSASSLNMMMFELPGYFNGSYWNRKPKVAIFAGVLWAIRSRFGQAFADKLAAEIVQELAEDPADIYADNPIVAEIRSLMLADANVESECDSWPQIQDILINSGIKGASKETIASQKFPNLPEPIVCTEKWVQ